jgi:hypothetical protein
MKKNILFINGHLNVGGCEKSFILCRREPSTTYIYYDCEVVA